MKQYEGKEFTFHSPFTEVEGWRTGDRGRLIHQVYPHGQGEGDHGNSVFAECPG